MKRIIALNRGMNDRVSTRYVMHSFLSSLYSHLSCFFFTFWTLFFSLSLSLNIHTNSFYGIAWFSCISATWGIESYYRQTKKKRECIFSLRSERTIKSLTIYWEWDEKTVKNWNECALTKKLYILPEKNCNN